MATTTPAIEVIGLTKYYGRHRGVEDVTLGVQYGEILGFLGPAGHPGLTSARGISFRHARRTPELDVLE